MKKLFTTASLAAALLMSGCANLNLPSIFTPDQVAAVQAATVKACGYLPEAETVASILFAENPFLVTAETIANDICAAVTTKTAVRGSKPSSVRNVVIEGKFVKR